MPRHASSALLLIALGAATAFELKLPDGPEASGRQLEAGGDCDDNWSCDESCGTSCDRSGGLSCDGPDSAAACDESCDYESVTSCDTCGQGCEGVSAANACSEDSPASECCSCAAGSCEGTGAMMKPIECPSTRAAFLKRAEEAEALKGWMIALIVVGVLAFLGWLQMGCPGTPLFKTAKAKARREATKRRLRAAHARVTGVKRSNPPPATEADEKTKASAAQPTV